VSYVDPKGRRHACTQAHGGGREKVAVNRLRWAMIGSDNNEDGAAIVGMRFLRVRLIDYGRAIRASATP
jgi:hypothetical protein